jgi:tetratricopeptide (TPR) repeat protein
MDPQSVFAGAIEKFREADLLENLRLQALTDAERQCDVLLRSNPTLPAGLSLLGAIYFKQGKYETALSKLRFAVAVDNQNLDTHAELIKALSMLGRRQEAIAAAEEMVLCLPKSGLAYKYLSDLYKSVDRIKDASLAFRRALELQPTLRQVRQAETYKARARRQRDGFFDAYCQGRGLDIGHGGDIMADNCVGWEFEDGDSESLEGVADEAYDFVYSSHNLEHLVTVDKALGNWWRVVKPGGYLIVFVPHRDLYEKRTTLPSRWAPDHRHFFLPDRDEAPDTIGLQPLIERVLPDAELVYIKVCDEGHTITDPTVHSDGEYSIEAVLRKRG